MTCGPYGPGWPQATTVREAYDRLRADCESLERLLESNPCNLDEKALKRADKAVTVMKVGFKILKKAIKKQPAASNVTVLPVVRIER